MPSIKETINEIEKIKQRKEDFFALDSDYPNGFTPYENEITVHLVVPILKALGWKPKQMSFECYLKTENEVGRSDILLYSQPSRKVCDIRIMVEVKTIGKDLEAPARDWSEFLEAKYLDYKNISKESDNNIIYLILTDGVDYHIYKKVGRGWENPDKFNFEDEIDKKKIKEFYNLISAEAVKKAKIEE